MRGQRLERGGRILRPREHDDLDLVELVLADHPARVAAGRARLGAEARRVRRVEERQLFGGQDLVAVQVRDRNLRRRDEVVALAGLEEVGVELRQLPGAEERVGVGEKRRQDLAVALLVDVHVEKELDERARHPRRRAGRAP